MPSQIFHRYKPRLRKAARELRGQPSLQTAHILNRAFNEVTSEPTGNPLLPEVAHHLGLLYRDNPIITMSPQDATHAIMHEDPNVMAGFQLTAATSIWTYFHQPVKYHPDLYADLERLSDRTIWTGHPYIPAARWEFPDGSALLSYGSDIVPGVHRDRIEDIRVNYMPAAHKSLDRVTAKSRFSHNLNPRIPIVPNPMFAPADDNLLSHQAVLPLNFTRCWCRYIHQQPIDVNHVNYP